jgi:O-antigen/teichoic acid export membrane protein
MAGRLSWGLADQAVSSMTNFAVGIYVARSLGVTAFGVFSLAWVTYGVVLNVSRGLGTDPLMVRYSGVSTGEWRAGVSRASGTAFAVGAAAGAVSVLFGLAIGGTIGEAFMALGIVLPALLLQDAWRFAFFAAGAGRRAFANDVVWAVALVPALLLAAQDGTVVAFVLAWGLSGAVAAAFGTLQAGMVPGFGQVRDWLADQRDLGSRYLVENVSNSGGSQLRMYGLGAIVGLAGVGTVRGAELLMGPFLAILMGLSLVTVSEAVRMLRRSTHQLWRFCLLLGAGQAGAALLWGLVLMFVPDRAGELALGDVWATAAQLILPITLSVAGASVCSGAAAGLRALGAARRSMRAQLVASLAYVTFGLAGAVMGGALGSAWGTATATWTSAVLWWLHLRAGLREHVSEPLKEVSTP